MEDSACQRTDLVAAILTFVYFIAAYAVVFRFGNTAFGAGNHTAKALLENIIQASIVVRKLLVQIVDGVSRRLHTTSVADLLHDVKG